MIAAARKKNPNAFVRWTPEEERRVREAFEGGEDVSSIARRHERSPRAIEMRLRRMGALPPE